MSIISEQHILGVILENPGSLSDIDLAPEDFSSFAYQITFKTMLEFLTSGTPIEIITLAEHISKELNQDAQDWRKMLWELQKYCIPSESLKQHVEQIKEDKLIRAGLAIAEMMKLGLNDNKIEVIDKAHQQIMDLTRKRKSQSHTPKESCTAALEELERVFQNKEVYGVSTGFKALNEITGGFRNRELTVIAGRPAMGKTALMLNMLIAANCNIGVISSEMSHGQLFTRLISKVGKIHAQRIRLGDLDEDHWPLITNAIANLQDSGIYINDTPRTTMIDVARQARKWVYQYAIKALYIDYMQKIEPADPRQPRHEQIRQIAADMKSLSEELDIPVISLSQVNRKVESRNDKRPSMSDLSDSSAIENYADLVITLYREDVYNTESDRANTGIAELGIKKNRHGQSTIVKIRWQPEFQNFHDIEIDNDEPY